MFFTRCKSNNISRSNLFYCSSPSRAMHPSPIADNVDNGAGERRATSPDSKLGSALASRLRCLTSLWERLISRNPGLSAGDQHHAEADFCLALCGRNHRQLHFRSHRRQFARAFIETALEILRNIRVEWIRRRIRRQRAVTKMLVHPEPGRGIFPDNRLELVPASLRHFLERSARGKFNPGMKNYAVTPAGQRLAMDVNEWCARALVQPHVSKGAAAFKPENLDRPGRQFRRNCQIDEQGEAFAAPQGPVQMHDGAFARCYAMAASLAQLREDRIQQGILELLRDNDTFHTGES